LPFKALRGENNHEVLSGAVDQSNLEPETVASILDELEDWGRYLSGEPEIIHTLRAFEEASQKANNEPEIHKRPSVKRTGPRP